MDNPAIRKRNVKASASYLCQLLQSLGVTGLTPETLRQAKYNNPSVAAAFWWPLHDLILLQLSCFPMYKECDSLVKAPTVAKVPYSRKSGAAKRDMAESSKEPFNVETCEGPMKLLNLREGKQIMSEGHNGCQNKNTTTELLRDLHSDFTGRLEDIVAFVKFYVALWGYPADSPFFSLSIKTGQSRQLLLAFAWLISYCDVFARGLEAKLRPLLVKRVEVPYLTSSPSSSKVAMPAREKIEEIISRNVSKADEVKDVCKRAEIRAQQALTLYGNVCTIMKSLHSLQAYKTKLIHEINLAQYTDQMGFQALTHYELCLLQDKEAFQSHLESIQAENAINEELSACENHEKNFWDWMESILDHNEIVQAETQINGLEQRECSIEEKDFHGILPNDLAPVIGHLREKLSSVGEISSCSNQNTKLDLPHDVLATLEPAFSMEDTKAPLETPGDSSHILKDVVYEYQPNRSLDSKVESAEHRIKRLADVSIGLEKMLEEKRAQNRSVIVEALKPILEDNDYVICGL